MKVVHIKWGFNLGGSESILVETMNELLKYNIELCLIVINSEYNEAILSKLEKSISVFNVERPPKSKNIKYLIRLNLIFRNIRPDIIVCHNNNIIKFIPFINSKKLVHVHCIGEPIRQYLHKYDKVLSISNAVSTDIKSRSNCSDPITVYNGMRLSDIKVKQTFDKNSEKTFRIVQIGRLVTSIKGQDLLVRAVKRLVEEGKINKIHVDFIGSGDSFEQLKSLVHQFGLDDKISFLGEINRQKVFQSIHSYDLLVQPSRTEGFGNTIVEAMAAKVPVLISNLSGPMEIIQNGRYGYFFSSNNHVECAERISNIIQDYKIGNVEKLVDMAYSYAFENFDITRSAKKMFSIYKESIIQR